jgi:RNA polymerase sigma-70 factor, ECF subfamily
MSEHDSLGDLAIELEELGRLRRPPSPDRLARTVHRLAQRYCRARLGALPFGDDLAHHLADEVTAALLRDRRRRFGRSLPVEAVVYPMMADAVSRALARVSPSVIDRRTSGSGRQSPAAPALGLDPHPHRVGVPTHVLAELNRLPRRPREVLVLRAFVGLSSEQVARAMGLSIDKVRAEQHRALAQLRPH